MPENLRRRKPPFRQVIVGLALIAGSTATLAIPACRPAAPPETPPQPRNCSLALDAQELDHPVWKQLGCGPVMRWFSGANAGLLGGRGSFCPDDPATVGDPAGAKQLSPLQPLGPRRTLLHENQLHGYTAGHAAPCIDVPTGQLFVFWSELTGPSCGSTCITQDLPPAF